MPKARPGHPQIQGPEAPPSSNALGSATVVWCSHAANTWLAMFASTQENVLSSVTAKRLFPVSTTCDSIVRRCTLTRQSATKRSCASSLFYTPTLLLRPQRTSGHLPVSSSQTGLSPSLGLLQTRRRARPRNPPSRSWHRRGVRWLLAPFSASLPRQRAMITTKGGKQRCPRMALHQNCSNRQLFLVWIPSLCRARFSLLRFPLIRHPAPLPRSNRSTAPFLVQQRALPMRR